MITELHEQQDFERLLEKSKTDPVLVFKHSTQCSISDAVLDRFNAFLLERDGAKDIECGIVLVLENRSVSDLIERQLGIPHESPQAILIDKGRQTWNASHWSITADALRKAVGA
jgi:bacillithiol system protein YtxJ